MMPRSRLPYAVAVSAALTVLIGSFLITLSIIDSGFRSSFPLPRWTASKPLNPNVEVTPLQLRRIKQDLVQGKISAVRVTGRGLRVGDTMPAGAPLSDVPPHWGNSLTAYKYIFAHGRIYFIDSSSHRIVQIVD